MDFLQVDTSSTEHITIENVLPVIGKDKIVASVYQGLTKNPKQISPVFFYDAAGSRLFEAITQLPEYYLTRTEKKLLCQFFGQTGSALEHTDIIELGSGDCSKISILLDNMPAFRRETIRYIPVDVSCSAIKDSAAILTEKYPELTIHGFIADFLVQLHLIPRGKRRLILFLGSTLGNLNSEQARTFFANLDRIMTDHDCLILGVDRVKPVKILHAAYNDSQDINKKFNLNILNNINNLTGSNFNPARFQHIAFFNKAHSRIEMHLKAEVDMKIESPLFPESIIIKKGEMIHTENSRKFTDDIIRDLTADTQLEITDIISDENQWFSLYAFEKAGTASC